MVYAAAWLGASGGEVLCWWLTGRKHKEWALNKKWFLPLLLAGNAALLLLAVFRERGGGLPSVWYFGLWSYLLCMVVYDLKYKELPDWYHLVPVGFYAAQWLIGCQPVGWRNSGLTVVVMGAALGLVYLIRRDAVGLGDIKLLLVCSLYAGYLCMEIAVRGMVAAFLCSVVFLLLKKVTMQSGLPFVPFLFLGAMLV